MARFQWGGRTLESNEAAIRRRSDVLRLETVGRLRSGSVRPGQVRGREYRGIGKSGTVVVARSVSWPWRFGSKRELRRGR
jgi:hypothetical protein